MAKDGNIYLIGPMGSGKTAVGRELARRLKRRFVDTDLVLERRCGASIEDVFAKRGEPAFRRLERDEVRRVAKRSSLVVALGGGAPAQPEVRRLLSSTGTTVLLTCDQRTLWKRLAPRKRSRPLLHAPSDAHSRARLASVIRKRKHAYPKGDFHISTTRLDAKAVARAIVRRLSDEERN